MQKRALRVLCPPRDPRVGGLAPCIGEPDRTTAHTAEQWRGGPAGNVYALLLLARLCRAEGSDLALPAVETMGPRPVECATFGAPQAAPLVLQVLGKLD